MAPYEVPGEAPRLKYVYESAESAEQKVSSLTTRAQEVVVNLKAALEFAEKAAGEAQQSVDSLEQEEAPAISDLTEFDRAYAQLWPVRAGQAAAGAAANGAAFFKKLMGLEQRSEALNAALARVDELRDEQDQVTQELVTEIRIAEQLRKSVLAEASVPVGPNTPSLEEIGADLARVEDTLKTLRASHLTLLSMPPPSRGFADVTGGFAVSVGVANQGFASAAGAAGVRVGPQNEETGRRPVYPFVDVFGTALVVGGGYTLSSEPNRSGAGFRLSTLVSLGESAASGRFISVSLPGIFSLSLRERGEAALSVNWPVSPNVIHGVTVVAGHPAMKGFIDPTLRAANATSMGGQEYFARMQGWLRSQVAADE